MSIASLKKYGIEYAPPKRTSHMLYQTADIARAFPFDWYCYMEQCELRASNSWRHDFLYKHRRTNSLFDSQKRKRYEEWLDMHKSIFQVLEEHIREKLRVKSFDVVAMLMSLWPFLPWDPSKAGVSGDLQFIQVKRLLKKTTIDDRKKIDVFLDHVGEACITKRKELLRVPRPHLFDIPYQQRKKFKIALLKRILLETPFMFWPMILARDKSSDLVEDGGRFEVIDSKHQMDVKISCWNNHLDGGHEVLHLWETLKSSQSPIPWQQYTKRSILI